MQKELRGNQISNKRKRRRSRRDQADIAPREPEEQSEEGNRHGGDAKCKQRMPQNLSNDSKDSVTLPEIADVADLLHGLRQQNVARDRSRYHQQDCRPCVSVLHEWLLTEASSASCSGSR